MAGIDVAKVKTAAGKLYLFLGLDRTSESRPPGFSTSMIAPRHGISSNLCGKPRYTALTRS
jgi:hypothetical protein